MKKYYILLCFTIIGFCNIGNVSALNSVVCTQELKLCSDGETYVGRGYPDCEFNACPSDNVSMCPAFTAVEAREGCYYEYEKDENNCDIRKTVCDQSVCPIVSAPFCEYGFTNLGTEIVDGCELPIFECNEKTSSDINLSTVIIPSLLNLTQGQAFTISSYASVVGYSKGTEITANSYLKNGSGKILETCKTSNTTVSNTLTSGTERIKNTCSMNYFKTNIPDGETYNIYTKLDFNNIFAETNENNNHNERDVIIGTKQVSCPIYSIVAPEVGCRYEYVKNTYGCDVPKLICDNELSEKIKKLADEAINTYETRLSELNTSNESKVKMIDALISKLKGIDSTDKSITVQNLIKYLVQELTEMKTRFQGDDVDDVFNLLN